MALRRNKRSLVAVGVIALVLLAAAIAEGDIAEDLTPLVMAILLLAVVVVREWRAWGARRALSG